MGVTIVARRHDDATTVRRYVVRTSITYLPSSEATRRPSLRRHPDSRLLLGALGLLGILERLRVRESLPVRAGTTGRCPDIVEIPSVLGDLHPPRYSRPRCEQRVAIDRRERISRPKGASVSRRATGRQASWLPAMHVGL